MPIESRQHVHIYCLKVNPPAPEVARCELPSPSAAADWQTSQFELSFEHAFERLELLPRMFVELDGSFVWSGHQGAVRWQIDGMLYDRAGRLQRVELAGHAPRKIWEQLLDVFGPPLDGLTIHCLQQQRFIDVAEFLKRVH